jgi:uncharacterized protein involved in response to NO
MRASISVDLTVRRPPGAIVLAYGFRPFFLAAAAWAIVALALWMLALAGRAPAWLAVDLAWHQHEMIFGVFGAALAGFLLTALPEWTKTPPLTGVPLALLVGLWLAGRAVMLSGSERAELALVTAAFLPCVALIGAAVVTTNRAPRLGLFVAAIAALGLFSAAWQAGRVGWLAIDPTSRALPALLTLAALITLASGRIMLVVSQLALAVDASARRLRADPASTALAGVMLLALAAAVAFELRPAVVGWIALAAAAAQVHRLSEWWIGRSARRPYVWPFHLGSLMIAGATAAIGLDRLGLPLPAGGIAHALGIGAAALVTLAVMTIAGLRHTGHALEFPRTATAALVCLAVAALARAAPLLAPSLAHGALGLSAVLWIAAFALYLVGVGPKLARPRVDGKPG